MLCRFFLLAGKIISPVVDNVYVEALDVSDRQASSQSRHICSLGDLFGQGKSSLVGSVPAKLLKSLLALALLLLSLVDFVRKTHPPYSFQPANNTPDFIESIL